jgi:hypothetical protein
MCLKWTTLVKSHFMPAALYAYCRDGPKSPIAVASGSVYPTDRQTWSYLLCSKCEDTLNKGGESWVGDKLARWEHGGSQRSFLLYEMLTERAPYYREGSTSLYFGAAAPRLKIDIVNVFSPSHAQVAMNDPYEGTRTGGYRNYFFHVLGVLFLLAVGKSLDAVMKSLCICNPGAPISVCDVLAGKFVQVLVREVQGSRTTKAYHQYDKR